MTQMAPFSSCLSVSTASVRGRDHLRLARNNQDAAAAYVGNDLLVAVVADGCSAGASSEVGARFAAAWLSRWVPRLVRAEEPARVWIDGVSRALLAALSSMACALSPSRDDLPMVVHDFLLFSFLAVVVERERTVVFGAGDGIYAVDGESVVLDPGPQNAPAYISYALLDDPIDARFAVRERAMLHREIATRDVRSVLVATDGVVELLDARGAEDELRDGTRRGDLAQFEHARYARNPSLLQKRLTVLGDSGALFRDDTTIALVLRKENG